MRLSSAEKWTSVSPWLQAAREQAVLAPTAGTGDVSIGGGGAMSLGATLRETTLRVLKSAAAKPKKQLRRGAVGLWAAHPRLALRVGYSKQIMSCNINGVAGAAPHCTPHHPLLYSV